MRCSPVPSQPSFQVLNREVLPQVNTQPFSGLSMTTQKRKRSMNWMMKSNSFSMFHSVFERLFVSSHRFSGFLREHVIEHGLLVRLERTLNILALRAAWERFLVAD